MSDSTAPKQIAHLFKPGQSGNPSGRPKGTHNKSHECLMKALEKDFEAHGDSVIVDLRTTKPVEYLKLYEKAAARYLPKDIQVDVSGQIEMKHTTQTFHEAYMTALRYLKAEPEMLEAESIDER